MKMKLSIAPCDLTMNTTSPQSFGKIPAEKMYINTLLQNQAWETPNETHNEVLVGIALGSVHFVE